MMITFQLMIKHRCFFARGMIDLEFLEGSDLMNSIFIEEPFADLNLDRKSSNLHNMVL